MDVKRPLSITHPDLAAEADGWEPSKVTAGSQKKLQWRCVRNHKWLATVKNRTSQKQGCPYCSGRRIIFGVNDLFSLSPKLSEEADGWDPSLVHRSSNKVMNWQCKKGHKWKAAVNNRSLRGDGCPICSGKQVLAGFNDLASLEPEIAREADGWEPSLVTKNSNKKVNWKCLSGHRWKVSINSRTTFRTGCPVCSGQKIVKGFNDLATMNPALAQEAYGWNPSEIAQWSHEIVTWKCTLGHSYKSRVADRSSGDGCPFCIGKKVLIGFNDLHSRNPSLAQEAFDWDPREVTEFSNKKLAWKCQQGHIWKSSVNHRSNGRGCPSCSQSGFDPNEQGYFYFLRQEFLGMLQIGITNHPEERIANHSRRGWEVIEIRGPMDGHLVRQWETSILRMLRANGADLSNKDIAGKFDGYSESWSETLFSVNSIQKLMELTEEFEK